MIAVAQTSINDMKAEMEAAWAQYPTTGAYHYNLQFTPEEFTAYLDSVKAEAERQEYNYQAWQEELVEIAEGREFVEEVVAGLAEDYPNANIKETVEEIYDTFDELEEQCNDEYEAVKEEGTYETDLEAQLEELEIKLEEMEMEAERQQENYDAYQKDCETLKAIEAKFEAAKKEIAAEYPAANMREEYQMVEDFLNSCQEEVDGAWAACQHTGNYSYALDASVAEEFIAGLVETAKAKAAKASAYNDALKAIEALQSKLDYASLNANGFYPDSDVTEEINAAQALIDAAKAAAEAAYSAEGDFTYTVPTAEIEAAIAKIIPEAKRQADNEAAFKATLDQIANLQDALDDAETDVAVQYPNADAEEVAKAVAAAQAAIDEAKAGAEAAYAAVANEGKYAYTVDKKAINVAIKNIAVVAAATGIDEIYVEGLGKEVKLYNMNGVQVQNPAAGTMVIAVDELGNTRKLIVK